MKKTIFILFCLLSINAFSQNDNTTQTLDLKVLGSINYGNQEVTTLIDSDGCIHKTIPHTVGLFIKDEIIKMKLSNDNLQMAELIKETITEKIFATKKCDQNANNVYKDLGLKLPDGSTITEIYDTYGNIIELYCTLSDGNIFVGTIEGNKMITTTSVSLTCTCTGSGGCKPFAAGGKMGCFTENCKECTGKTTKFSTKETFEFYFIQKGTRTTESNLAYLTDSRMLYTYDEWLKYPFVTSSEINKPEFKKILNEIVSNASKFGAEDLVAVPIIINGKKMLLNVPFKAVENGGLYIKAISSTEYSCSGSCGTDTKCKKETASFGQVVYCTGCNSGCTLKMK